MSPRKMKLWKSMIGMVILALSGSVFGQTAARGMIPAETLLVVSVKGEGFEIKSHGELVRLRPGMRLHREAQVEMKDFSLAEFVSSAGDQFFIYGPSQINFLYLQSDGSLLLNLQKGQMRWVSSSLRDQVKNPGPPISKVLLKTDLVELELTAADAGFLYDPLVPRVEVFNMRGNSLLRVRESFESVRLEGKQKVYFQGVMEDGEIAYDLLLEGKKIPKGILSPPLALTAEEERIFVPAVKARAKKEAPANAASSGGKKSTVKKSPVARIKSHLCEKPMGKLNECAWVCDAPKGLKFKNCPTEKKDVQCVRRRCDANGEWRDPFALPAEAGKLKCTSKALVAPCDY